MIDAHIHLQDERFDADRDDLIRQAKNKGVTAFFCASTCPRDARNVIELAQKHARIIPFIGTHPWFSDEYDPQDFETLLKNYPHAGIGEIGLDGLRGQSNQEFVFQDQLNIAARLNRPCVIHCVKSFDPVARIIKQTKKLPPALLLHGFSGTKQQADFFLRCNAYFSFSGSALFDRHTKIQTLISVLPADRILIETDAPDMRPPDQFCINRKEKRNVPENLALIIQGIAAIKNIDVFSFTAILDQNAQRFLSGLNYGQ